MHPYKVISAFKDGGTLVSPPGQWTPPNQAEADRLIKARCLRPYADGRQDLKDKAAADAADAPKAAAKAEAEAKIKAKAEAGEKAKAEAEAKAKPKGKRK